MRLPAMTKSKSNPYWRTVSGKPLTQKVLRTLLKYDPMTGEFVWRVSVNPRAMAGKTACVCRSKGYAVIQVDGVQYAAHRLAWLYVHGVWPTEQLDHINGVRDDNRMVNLREATSAQNHQNRRAAQSSSKTGILGVSVHKSGMFMSQIKRDYKVYYLGLHITEEEAQAAYVAAKRSLHPFGTL